MNSFEDLCEGVILAIFELPLFYRPSDEPLVLACTVAVFYRLDSDEALDLLVYCLALL